MDKLIDIFNDYVEGNINPKTNILDLNLDDISIVDIIMDIEDEFNIVFDYDDLSNFKTIKDLFDYINEE